MANAVSGDFLRLFWTFWNAMKDLEALLFPCPFRRESRWHSAPYPDNHVNTLDVSRLRADAYDRRPGSEFSRMTEVDEVANPISKSLWQQPTTNLDFALAREGFMSTQGVHIMRHSIARIVPDSDLSCSNEPSGSTIRCNLHFCCLYNCFSAS